MHSNLEYTSPTFLFAPLLCLYPKTFLVYNRKMGWIIFGASTTCTSWSEGNVPLAQHYLSWAGSVSSYRDEPRFMTSRTIYLLHTQPGGLQCTGPQNVVIYHDGVLSDSAWGFFGRFTPCNALHRAITAFWGPVLTGTDPILRNGPECMEVPFLFSSPPPFFSPSFRLSLL